LGHIWGMNHRTTAVTSGPQRKARPPGLTCIYSEEQARSTSRF
jgi:hypothetical protein